MPKRPTIIDVAKYAGVSKSTVSRVISGGSVREETRQRVEAAINALGYAHNAIASSMRTNRTNIIMLAIPDITNPFWPDVARGVQDVMDEAGYAVVFANSDWRGDREKMFLQMAQRNRFDGVLINPIQVTAAELLETHLPTVLIGSRTDYSNFDTVGSDSYGGTWQALEHLRNLGHRRIGLIRGKRVNRPGVSRMQSYINFLKKYNLPYDETLIVEYPFDQQGGYQGAMDLLKLPNPPTAILAANDILAMGAIQAAHDMGLAVPGNVSIVGQDDIFAAKITVPPLTTVAKQKYAIGAKAAKFLLAHIKGESPNQQHYLFPCHLKIRGSTAPPKR